MPPASERFDYAPDELLGDGAVSAPLIAGGVLCHGGFDALGRYVSPRTLHRNPAVEAWQRKLQLASQPLIAIGEDLLPPQYPSVEQAKLLLERGFPEPVVRALTVISILEGFGAIIRDVQVPDLRELFIEPIDGTALAHLDRGLFEAHARDEAGYRDQGGHKQMWEAARDLALENPKIPGDVFLRLMGDRGQSRGAAPLFPQLEKKLYRMLSMMSQVFVIEVFARRTFDWGIALLADPEVSAAPREASAMVSYIQSDESPHVEYLRTALSEARARQLRTSDGSTIAGRTVVDGILHSILSRMIDARPREQRDTSRGVLAQAVQSGKISASLVEEFDALAPSFVPPARTGFEPAAAA
jgi:hypothetical protein